MELYTGYLQVVENPEDYFINNNFPPQGQRNQRYATVFCKFCKKRGHQIQDCRNLQKKICPLCGQRGHTQNWCRNHRPAASITPDVSSDEADDDGWEPRHITARPTRPTNSNSEKRDDSKAFKCEICFETYQITDGRILCNDFYNTGIGRANHPICVDCIRGLARTAIGDAALPPGGIGLKCVEAGCRNVILFNDFYFYLDDSVHTALSKRLQAESIAAAAAKTDDLVRCNQCGMAYVGDPNNSVFTCPCGYSQCQKCNAAYHPFQTCEEVQRALRRATQIDDIVVRKCTRCHAQFIKEDGCNHMTCRCGQHYCYLCHKAISGYDHFCQCGNINLNGRPCPQCRKTCLIHESAEEIDERRIERLDIN